MKLARELSQKLFFSPEQIAEEGWLGFTMDEIFHLGVSKRLIFHAFTTNVYRMAEVYHYLKDVKNGIKADRPRPYDKLPLQVPANFLWDYINPTKDQNDITQAIFTEFNEELGEDDYFVPFSFEAGEVVQTNVACSRLVIMKESLEKFERENQNFLKCLETPVNDTILSKLLDPDHNWYSSELAIAVKAWIELYADHEGHRGSNDFKPFGGHPEMIAEWLEKNHGKKTTHEARVRIAAVVNPCQITGAGKCQKWHGQQ